MAFKNTGRVLSFLVLGIPLLAAGRGSRLEAKPPLRRLPVPDHVVLVIMENHSFSEIIGSGTGAPYINSLATAGTSFINSTAITHPSEPNYLDLFSGSNWGVTDDTVPPPGSPYAGPDLAGVLVAAGKTFSGYCESMPSAGFAGDSYPYVRKHNPMADFTDVSASQNQPFTSFPGSSSFATLPTVSIVVPNMLNDMHDGSVSAGDTWLSTNIDAYKTWAMSHNSLLIVTWDEDDGSTPTNQIPTIFVGAMVSAAFSDTTAINHFKVLRTICDMYGATPPGSASSATAITDCWTTGGGSALTVTTTSLAGGTVGTAYSAGLTASGGTSPYTWSISTGSLPPGLSLSGATISGTPTTSGTFSFTVKVTDSASPPATATKALSIAIAASGGGGSSLSVTTTSLPGGTVGTAYSAGLSATGGTPPYTWSISTGSLPPGLSLSGATISGSPTTAGTFSFTVQVTDSSSPPATATKPLSIAIAAGGGGGGAPVSIATTSMPGATAGTSYSSTLSASGGTLPYTWSISSGSLPAGLSLTTSSGNISGTPTTAGTSSFTVQVTDSSAPPGTATKSLSIVVSAASGGGSGGGGNGGGTGGGTGTASSSSQSNEAHHCWQSSIAAEHLGSLYLTLAAALAALILIVGLRR